jgi:hypothetical protein
VKFNIRAPLNNPSATGRDSLSYADLLPCGVDRRWMFLSSERQEIEKAGQERPAHKAAA